MNPFQMEKTWLVREREAMATKTRRTALLKTVKERNWYREASSVGGRGCERAASSALAWKTPVQPALGGAGRHGANKV